MIGGFQDLYIYDLRQNALRRLTNDPYADMQPSWSPDGRTIAFSTDQFTTNAPRPSRREPAAGPARRRLGGSPRGGRLRRREEHQPEVGGQRHPVLRLGSPWHLERLPPRSSASHATTQVTNLLGGASGITELSPALGVSKSRLAFSVYQNDSYNIYTLDTPDALAGSSLVEDTGRNAGVLPPRRSGEGIVYAYLHNDAAGLPAASTSFPTKPYQPPTVAGLSRTARCRVRRGQFRHVCGRRHLRGLQRRARQSHAGGGRADDEPLR